MKFDRESVLGILFCLYLKRSGRANVQNASLNLNCSHDHLQLISNKLRKKQILNSKKGPGGGFELVGDPTILQIVSAIKGYSFVKSEEKTRLNFGEFEQRALSSLFLYLTKTANITISQLVDMQGRHEKVMLDSVEGAISQ